MCLIMGNTLKKIFVCEFLQESNSFNPVLTNFDEFASRGIFEGDALIQNKDVCGRTVCGILDAIEKGGYTAVGGVRMSSGSAGPLDTKAIVDYFREKNRACLRAVCDDLSGVVLSMHGASVSDTSEDVCGDILEEIRGIVGQDMPIAVAFDLHANATDKICRHADFVCGYQTYPHIDHYEVGVRAASLVLDRLSGKAHKMAKADVPMMAPAHAYTTTGGALKCLMQKGFDKVRSGEIIDFSVFQVQPWMDIEKIASTVTVIAEDENVAKKVASELAKDEFAIREELLGTPLYSIDDVIKIALDNDSDEPVVLVNSADSSNAGANGDSAAVLEKVLPYKDVLACATMLTDKAAIEKAFSLGEGAVADFTLGASIATALSKPIQVKQATVKSLHDGKFLMHGPAEKGEERDIGKTAVLQVGKVLIHLCSRSQNNGDLNFYRSFGIEPCDMQLVEVKACTSFRAGYLPITSKIYNTMAPGAACPVLTNLPYKKLPKPFYPFDEITEKDTSEAKCFR